MKISIIVTNFNYGKYISRCLRSCLSQNFEKRDYEIIVVDDNSTDNSLKNLNYFKNNIKLIQNKKNLGVAASANRAILKAKGEYIIRVDADDYISNYTLNFLYGITEFFPDYFGIACDYVLVKNDDTTTKSVDSKEFPISCGILYNRKKFIKYGMYNSNFRHREEEELRVRLDDKYKIYNLNLPLYKYRIHNNNKTRSKNYIHNFKRKIEKLTTNKNKKNIKKSKLLKNVVAIIPARGNSKRFKNKNIYNVQGLPMLSWVVNECKKSLLINNIYVTSEDDKIIKNAKSLNVKTIKRPKKLSKDDVIKLEPIKHAVKEIELKTKKKVSLVLSVQPNSPELKMNIIENAIMKIINENLQEVITVNSDLNCNAALRIMTRESLFQTSLSTNHGFLISNITDIHFKNDLKKLRNLWK